MTPRVVSADSPGREELARRLDGVRGLFVALDFDGTLAPISTDPDEPVVTQECRRALQEIVSCPDTSGAVISGREVVDLRSRVGVEGLAYAGNHGLQIDDGGRTTTHSAARRHRPSVERVLDRLRERLVGVPGWAIEDKGITATVHVRNTPDSRVEEVRAAVLATVREVDPSLVVTSGKQVFEIRPAVDWDKGDALRRLAESAPEVWSTVYVGDDTTDEDAFRALLPDGVGVLVGPDRRTAATYRLPNQDDVGGFLRWLVGRVSRRNTPRSR